MSHPNMHETCRPVELCGSLSISSQNFFTNCSVLVRLVFCCFASPPLPGDGVHCLSLSLPRARSSRSSCSRSAFVCCCTQRSKSTALTEPRFPASRSAKAWEKCLGRRSGDSPLDKDRSARAESECLSARSISRLPMPTRPAATARWASVQRRRCSSGRSSWSSSCRSGCFSSFVFPPPCPRPLSPLLPSVVWLPRPKVAASGLPGWPSAMRVATTCWACHCGSLARPGGRDLRPCCRAAPATGASPPCSREPVAHSHQWRSETRPVS